MAEITKTTEMPNLPNDIVVIAITLDIQKNGQKKLPYQHFSNYQPQPSFSQPSFSQPQMTTPMMPQYKPMTQAWSPYYDANMAQNQKYLGKPHITRSFSASPNPSSFSSINVLSSKPRTSLFSASINFTFPIKALIDTGAFCSAMLLNILENSKKKAQPV